MSVLKCKICGGNVAVQEGQSLGICEYCGNTVTLPKIEDEQRVSLYNRGNHFRMKGEYDRALAVFEQIIALDDTDAEAHWNIVLCRYGIEYVEDPDTHKHIATCHRASWDSILDDVDYLAALKYADPLAKEVYEREGKYIDDIQKGILAISRSEEPYDIFICYKETTDGGSRTKDSVYAQDLYSRLVKEGYRVFFARITLEDKLGQQYEPYIFSALNSAKVMLVIGTSSDNFNAPWVRNEWSRFLALMKKAPSKLLIPCYRDMDPYDLPDELAMLQSQDMGKIGFEQDLLRGIEKIIKPDHGDSYRQSLASADVSALLRRAELFLEDSDWKSANQYYDRALDLYPECSEAYVGKFLAKYQHQSLEDFNTAIQIQCDTLPTAQVKVQPTQLETITAVIIEYQIPGHFENAQIQQLLRYPKPLVYDSIIPEAEKLRIYLTETVFKDSNLRNAHRFGNDMLRGQLNDFMQKAQNDIEKVIADAEIIDGEKIEQINKDFENFFSDALIKVQDQYQAIQNSMKAAAERDHAQAAYARKQKEFKRRLKIVAVASVLFLIIGVSVVNYFKDQTEYQNALNLLDDAETKLGSQRYEEAIEILLQLDDIDGADATLNEAYNSYADYLVSQGRISDARTVFNALDPSAQDTSISDKLKIAEGEVALEEGNVGLAAASFGSVSSSQDSISRSLDLWNQVASRSTIAVTDRDAYIIKNDHTVLHISLDDDLNVEYEQIDGWNDIISLSACDRNVVGLASSGTVYSIAELENGTVGNNHIISVDAASDHSSGLGRSYRFVGVTCAGEIVGAGYNEEFSASLPKIVSAKQDFGGTIYGSFVACLDVYGNVHVNNPEFETVTGWSNITQLEVGAGVLYGIDQDGTLYCYSKYYARPEWTDLKKIVVAPDGSICGLRNDGTILFTNDEGEEVSYEYPSNVVDIAYGSYDRNHGSARIFLTATGEAHITIYSGYNLSRTIVVDNVLLL